MVLFNSPVGRTNVRKLEKHGMLLSRAYEARRAFQVEELDEEGLHYFIELEDHGTLFLSGQYLYNYNCEDQPRTSPALRSLFGVTVQRGTSRISFAKEPSSNPR
jgi:hypothetical protein